MGSTLAPWSPPTRHFGHLIFELPKWRAREIVEIRKAPAELPHARESFQKIVGFQKIIGFHTM